MPYVICHGQQYFMQIKQFKFEHQVTGVPLTSIYLVSVYIYRVILLIFLIQHEYQRKHFAQCKWRTLFLLVNWLATLNNVTLQTCFFNVSKYDVIAWSSFRSELGRALTSIIVIAPHHHSHVDWWPAHWRHRSRRIGTDRYTIYCSVLSIKLIV